MAEPLHYKISSPDGEDKGGVTYVADSVSDAAIHNNTLDRHENQRFSRDDKTLVIASE